MEIDNIYYYNEFFFNRFFVQTAKVLSASISVHVICNMIYLSSSIFEIDLVAIYEFFRLNFFFWLIQLNFLFHRFFFQQIKHLDTDVCIVLVAIMTSFSNLFLFCHFGKLATESYQRMADSMFNSNWQRFPIELQKYVILIIANMQRPLHYNGIKMAILDLVLFNHVRKIHLFFKFTKKK